MKRYPALLVIGAFLFLAPPWASAAKPACNVPISEIFKRVSPAVVYISAISINPYRISNRVSTSVGSGFIIDKKGLILTNSHVVDGSQAIQVKLDDGGMAPAELLGADPILDLAVLSVPEHPGGLPTAVLGDSDALNIGDEVLAVGNPMGLEQTLTRGVVSGLDRILPVSPMSLLLALIQTDAAINPGNSGGPLFNRCGEVVGINTAALADTENIGFAVPINTAKRVVPELIEHGRVVRPWLGVSGKLIGKDYQVLLNLPLAEGFLVEAVEPGSPAAKAGVRGGKLPISIAGEEFLFGGDIITGLNGQQLDDPEKFNALVRSLKVNETVTLTIFRAGEELQVSLRITERPPYLPDAFSSGE